MVPIPDVGELAMAIVTAEQVRAEVDRLPREQREAIELAYFGGRTYRQVAEELGIPEGTAKSRMRLGLARIAQALEAQGVDSRMDVTRSEFQDLVGAYALDACDPEEAVAIDSFIAEHADAAAEAERLRDVAAWLGAAGALNPPVRLRDRVLAAAVERLDPLPPVDALRRETERFEALLDSLEPRRTST